MAGEYLSLPISPYARHAVLVGTTRAPGHARRRYSLATHLADSHDVSINIAIARNGSGAMSGAYGIVGNMRHNKVASHIIIIIIILHVEKHQRRRNALNTVDSIPARQIHLHRPYIYIDIYADVYPRARRYSFHARMFTTGTTR